VIHSLLRLQDHDSITNSLLEAQQGVLHHYTADSPYPPDYRRQIANGVQQALKSKVPDPHKYTDTRPQNKRTYSRDRLRLLFARLRSQFETQTLMDGVNQAQNNWLHAPSQAKPLFPSDDLLQAAQYFRKAGDPRSEILGWHADLMDGLKNEDPQFLHNSSSRDRRPLTTTPVPLPDGSLLHVESTGHNEYPGVHSVGVTWTPKGSQRSYFSHWHPDEARGLADRFGAANEAVGRAIHDA
jgi:hypothetical protein